MDKDKIKGVIAACRRNGIAMSDKPLRNAEDYKFIMYKNEQGNKMLKLVKKDTPLQHGEKEFNFETFLEIWDEGAFGRPPEKTIDDDIDKIIREYQTFAIPLSQGDEINNILN